MKAMYLPEVFHSERLSLKKHSLALAEKMFACVEQDRGRLRQFLSWVDETKTVEDERNYIRFMEEQWQLSRHFDYGIYLSEDRSKNPSPRERYLGNIGVFNLAWAQARCEIGYWILGQYEGHGYMTEAVKLLETHLFERGFHRIEIRCSERNQRSAGIPKRLGYSLEGRLTDYLFEMNAYHNLDIYAKINPKDL